jgi:DUF438 domain-containing protein
MNAITTIDVKGLDHGAREELIFPSVEKLNKGETLRIIAEFNPVPLAYMLEARGEFEVGYEKKGPDEWILKAKRVAVDKDAKSHLKELLKELRKGEVSEDTIEKTKQLFQAVSAKTLGYVEQELIREGVSHEEIRRSLCDIHLEVLRDSLVSKRVEVTSPHPVYTLMEEHKIILDSLGRLRSLVQRLKGKNMFDEMGEDLDELKDIAHHLVEAESHHQREEEVLFPRLEKHNIVEPAEVMRLDHEEFKEKKKKLYNFAHNARDYDFGHFRDRVVELGEYLADQLDSHIFKEDNILYQIALEVLSDDEWEEVKRECDKIGYCCYTPEDQLKD